MPQFVISMPGDVRTECKNALKEFATKETSRKRPARLTFYDAKGGASGSGISTKAFEFIDLLLVRACDRVAACHCTEGCLECCCSEACKEHNMVMSKAGSEVILKCLMGQADSIDVENLPWGPEDEKVPAGIETVVAAETVRQSSLLLEVDFLRKSSNAKRHANSETVQIRPARGRILEEVLIKREAGGVQRVVLDHVGDGEDLDDAVVEIKEEPIE